MSRIIAFIKIFSVILFSFFILFSCRKDEYKRITKIETTRIYGVMSTSAVAMGNIIDLGEGITEHGHCWALTTNPDLSDSITSLGIIDKRGTYTSELKNLINGKIYHIRAYARNGDEVYYSKEQNFQTLSGKALVSTTNASNITTISATSGGIVSFVYGDRVIKKGICWDTVSTFTFSKNLGHIESATEFGYFSCELTGLIPNRNYYVAAYSITSVDTSLGNVISFKTLNGIANISTTNITNITINSASSGGSISNNGGDLITARGVCWNTTGNPTISDSTTIDGTGNGIYTSQLSGLKLNTKYYLRAYATNSVCTTYGSQNIFTTPNGIPDLTTTSTSNITINSATSGGNITDNGGATITARGVCWNTSGLPTLRDNKTDEGGGNGTFTSQMTGLLINTNYYVRAFAINSVDTTYGPEVTFITYNGLPSLTSIPVTNIGINSAICGGEVTDDWGFPVISKGVCWSTSSDPTIDSTKTIDGNGTGTFISNLTNLTSGTFYYIRAYATNANGTNYGSQQAFKTYFGTLTDIDGNIYQTTLIGSQVWMAENLRTKKYMDGNDIPLVTDANTYANLSTPAYCWYNNDETTYKNPYGALYNWYTINTNKLCPAGWHVPTYAEWTTLANSLGGYYTAGVKLKETGTVHWNSPNLGATNSSGFTGIPGGYRNRTGAFVYIRISGCYWTSLECSSWEAFVHALDNGWDNLSSFTMLKTCGNSIRCIKD